MLPQQAERAHAAEAQVRVNECESPRFGFCLSNLITGGRFFNPIFAKGNRGKEESVATFKGNEFFCYDLSLTPIQSSTDEITLSFRTLQRNGLMLHTGKSADYVNLSLKSGAVWLVINLGSGAFEALVEPVNGKFNDNAWHDVRVTRNLRQVNTARGIRGGRPQSRRAGGASVFAAAF
ncbi:Neurexin-2 [Liparis tanakae]|uniref:Neurexin-2 n=1 Tax=Liparis tanakae TaxID=230148 RepID=A0A4Z2GKQ5_9TELE|nr:Neurexin-2 [Liparis tanakae]